MKKLITGYQFTPQSGLVRLTDFTTINQENLLLITNVSSGQIIYNFADSGAGGFITGQNSIKLTYQTSGTMSSGDKLQIFYDVSSEAMDLASGYLTGVTGSTGLYSPVVPMFFNAVGGRAVDMNSGFYPDYKRNSDVIFNMDKDTGGTLAYQADLDKDIDSVTTFDVGYASISNYLTGIVTGTNSSGVGLQIVSGNANRITLFGQNLGDIPLYVKYGLGCNVQSFNFILYPGTSIGDGRGEKFTDDRYKGDISVNVGTSGQIGRFLFWEGV
jgi:hypothetical protein